MGIVAFQQNFICKNRWCPDLVCRLQFTDLGSRGSRILFQCLVAWQKWLECRPQLGLLTQTPTHGLFDMVVSGQWDIFHDVSKPEKEYSKKDRSFQPSYDLPCQVPNILSAAFYWLNKSLRPAQIQGEEFRLHLLMGGVAKNTCPSLICHIILQISVQTRPILGIQSTTNLSSTALVIITILHLIV